MKRTKLVLALITTIVMTSVIAVGLNGCGGGGGGGGLTSVTVSGRVLDATTEVGVPNASVTIVPSRAPSTRTALTNADGTYAIRDIPPGPASVSVSVTDGSYAASRLDVTVPYGRLVYSVTVRLVRTVTPPTGVVLSPKDPTVPAGSTQQFTAAVSPDSSVKATFTSVGEAGGITADGLFVAMSVGTCIVAATAGSVSDSTTVTVAGTATTGTICGIVTYDGAQPVPDAMVTVSCPDIGVTRNDRTDADGVYVLSDLPPGYYYVHANKTGYPQGDGVASLGAGQTVVVELVLQEGSVPPPPTL